MSIESAVMGVLPRTSKHTIMKKHAELPTLEEMNTLLDRPRGQKKMACTSMTNCIIHGIPGTYSMTMVRSHKGPFSIQIHEATEIQHSTADSKNEINGPRIPRISIEIGSRVITPDYRGQQSLNRPHNSEQQIWSSRENEQTPPPGKQ